MSINVWRGTCAPEPFSYYGKNVYCETFDTEPFFAPREKSLLQNLWYKTLRSFFQHRSFVKPSLRNFYFD